MELPNIGHHCSQINCKQLDFLPIQCKCNKQFCSEHFNEHAISCATTTTSNNNSEVELKKILNTFKCSYPNCKITSVVPIECSKCHNYFCIKHRHVTECFQEDPETRAAKIEKYAAPVRQFNEAKSAVDKQVEDNLNKAKKTGKNKDIANKVQLMKIKTKATGAKSIPINDRVYFNIKHPKKDDDNKPMFVSKLWTVGRAIDAIAVECQLSNNNHKSLEKKLRLFKQDNGKIISRNVSDTLESLLKDKVILNGDNLIIEYADTNCEQLL